MRYLLSVFFHLLNIYLPLFPWQDSSRASFAVWIWRCHRFFVWNTVAVVSLLFLLLPSIAVKHEMTAGSLCCFFPALFVFLQANGKLLLCPSNPMWNRINSRSVSSDQQVTSVAVYTLDHRYIDFHVFLLFFLSPLFSSILRLSSLPSLLPTSLSLWLFFFSLSASLSCYFVSGATSKVVHLFPPRWRPQQHGE